jgi:hypothetical protein
MSNGAGSHERAQPNVLPEPRSVIDERRVNAWIGKSLTIQGRVMYYNETDVQYGNTAHVTNTPLRRKWTLS